MFKLDLPPLSPKHRKNREARVYYLKQTKEHADTLYEIVEQAKALKPLDNALDYACGTNLYTLSLEDMLKSSPICLFPKLQRPNGLWHRRLSHLNFGIINQLAKQGLVRGLPKLKYEKDHLCSACSLRKSKKHSHKPKSENSIQEKLYLLHMDLCGPIHVESINEKKYILIIVDDYSRTHTKPSFLNTLCSTKQERLDILFQPMFNEYFQPSPKVVSLVPPVVAPIPDDTTDTPSSTIIDQDAPSTSTSTTIEELQAPLTHQEPSSDESSSRDVRPLNLQQINQPFDHIKKWTKDHPLDIVIGNPS
ncbi:retrovirus-related pol polyprotein from transposon TNT 1-94 [Tanacetum coccineum]